ncbi:hypothetical protein SAMN04244573_04473 [Azotobacter beijerinckii]|uniref:DUF4145 domain-containing protein n=1 Tax=Azotobacter beijerinckii TaxID=170623 RepID=A0A1H9SMV5_9GAMM|nr:hypothetical protein [Azotobacter beijerinckii]SER86218.1 hypothetical protein SAMN04244573_04473 [Azotobacter beijerinckii]
MKFKNQEYEELVRDLINDAFYIESRSNRGKISTIRQCAEVVIRKLLNSHNNNKITLGDFDVIRDLEAASSNNKLLIKSVRKLQKLGNKCTHTQTPQPITDENVNDAVNALLNLYASLFVLYFKKFKFGSNSEVLSAFSILPPIIRYIVLEELYKDDRSNISIIDKLSLVLLKAFDKDSAMKWIEKRKDELSNILPYTQEAIAKIESIYGKSHAAAVIANAPESMYTLCLERLEQVSLVIDERGLLYNSFEQAKTLYLEKGILPADSQEYRDFNDIMEFVYLGRKAEHNEKLDSQHLYTIIN